MPDKIALVVGPTGATGGPIAAALARRSGWHVYGMSRNPPSGEAPFTHVAADLTDPASCRRALASIEPVTHAFFAARAPFREGGVEDVEGNVAMLAATLDALASRAEALDHVHLLEGIKWYGMHLGPYPTPSREDDPRHLPPTFPRHECHGACLPLRSCLRGRRTRRMTRQISSSEFDPSRVL